MTQQTENPTSPGNKPESPPASQSLNEAKGSLVQGIWLQAMEGLEKIKALLNNKDGKEKAGGGLIAAAMFFLNILTKKNPLAPKTQETKETAPAKKTDRPRKKAETKDVSADDEGGNKESKEPTIEDLAEIPDKKERIVKIAEKMVQDKVKAAHCWDWIEKIYTAAKVTRKVVFSSFNQYEGRDCGSSCASDNQLNQIEAGDHIFINNKNKYDQHGNHSVIFLGWIDREKRTARLAGYPGNGRPPVVYTRSLFREPVTYIAKPE